ncbi:MAG: hypothetical protein IJP03_02985, partial [Christensenellaceae bacterium]|nr:hypothetical protein [Christensenellaceae bacterium]
VAGKNLVPSPAAGMTTLRIFIGDVLHTKGIWQRKPTENRLPPGMPGHLVYLYIPLDFFIIHESFSIRHLYFIQIVNLRCTCHNNRFSCKKRKGM